MPRRYLVARGVRKRGRPRKRVLYGRRGVGRFLTGYSQFTVHRFKRAYVQAPITVTDASVGQGFFFTLGSVSNVAEFTSLFDQYRIRKITQKFFFTRNAVVSNVATATVVNPNWRLFITTDLDDATVPTSVDEILQYQSYKVFTSDSLATKGCTISWVPRTSVLNYQAGVAYGYGSGPRNQWLDCANTAIEHYGIKYWIDSTTDSSAGTRGVLQILNTYHLEFRGVR